MSVTLPPLRLEPPIPLMVVNDDGSMTEAAAYFLQDMGMESEDFWVMFMPNGEIRWVPNSKVRCCGNWSLGRAKPTVTATVNTSAIGTG